MINMNKSILKYIFLVTGLLITFALFKPQSASANVGIIELRPTNNEDYRCYAHSLLTGNNKYDIAVNCVNLVFPIDPPQISTYVVWATPTAGRNKNQPIRLGDLGKGIARYEIVDSFTELYVTVENNGGVRNPSSNVVMRGSVEPITFLERPTSPTPTPEVKETDKNGTAKKTDTSTLTTRQKLLLALKRAGIAAVIALVAIVGLIFVVTRSRG